MSTMRLVLLIVLCLAVLSSAVIAEPVLLKDVPRTTWSKPYLPVMILQTALAGMGCHTSYEELMVASGAAFRTGWRVGDYNFPAATLYQQDPIAMGAGAVGAKADRKQYTTFEAAFEDLKAAIDAGRTVIAWDSGRYDLQVICGYDEDGPAVFRRMADTGEAPDRRPLDCLKSCVFSEAPCELWLLSYDASKPPPPLNWPFILANALRLAQWPDDERLYNAYVCGECASYCLATDLRQSTLHERFPTAGQVTWYEVWLLEKSRLNAANVLQANLGVHPALGQAALLYQDEAALFGKAQEVLCGGKKLGFKEASPVAGASVRNKEVREAVADLVEQAVAKDRAARAALAQALRDIAPDLAPPAVEAAN